MAIEGEDWVYLGGAAVGGALLASLVSGLVGTSAGPVYTGLSRVYAPPDGKGKEAVASILAVPGDGYVVEFKGKDGKDVFPDLEQEILGWPFAAALWADDVMWNVGYEPRGAWAPVVNEASELRRRERGGRAVPAVSGRRRA